MSSVRFFLDPFSFHFFSVYGIQLQRRIQPLGLTNVGGEGGQKLIFAHINSPFPYRLLKVVNLGVGRIFASKIKIWPGCPPPPLPLDPPVFSSAMILSRVR